MDYMIEEHPVLLFFLLFLSMLIFEYIRTFFNEKKGINSKERQNILDILRTTIPETEAYIPVYAHWTNQYCKSTNSVHYALGLTAEKLYIIPLQIAGNVIGYSTFSIIEKGSYKKLDCGKPGGPIHFVHFYDHENNIIFKFMLDEKNTKLSKGYPVNITQVEEVRNFMEQLEKWSV